MVFVWYVKAFAYPYSTMFAFHYKARSVIEHTPGLPAGLRDNQSHTDASRNFRRFVPLVEHFRLFFSVHFPVQTTPCCISGGGGCFATQ